MEFTSPFSRIEAILQNILGADNVLEDPLSRAEVILLAILNDTEITEELDYNELSELEALLYAIKESDEEYDEVPETRSGKILLKILHGEKYEGETASRVEELLKEWSHAAAWYTKTVGPSNPISVSDALAEPAVELKVNLSPIQASAPWIDTEANTTPYLLRPTETTGNTADEKLVGGSVVWNQINRQDADFFDTEVKDCDVTMTESRLSYQFQKTAGVNYQSGASHELTKGHLFYIIGKCRKSSTFGGNILIDIRKNNDEYSSANAKKTVYVDSSIFEDFSIFEKTDNEYYLLGVRFPVSASRRSTILVSSLQIFDLTQMFANNPAIADYAYSLEQSEAGSGIAWLKAHGFFTKDYYPYNPGEIMSTKAFSKKVVGFNLWNEQWESGTINNVTGQNSNSSSHIRSENYIPVIPNTVYYCHNGSDPSPIYTGGRAYDNSKNYIGVISSIGNSTFTTPENCYYIRFVAHQTTYNNDICINLSDPNRNGEYEPYKEETYTLGNDELRGLFKLDTTTNKLYTEGDVKTSDGEIERKYAIVDLGSLTYTKAIGFTNKDCFYTSINSLPSVPDRSSARIPNAISTKFLPTYQNASVWDINTFVITVGAGVLPANSLGFIVSLNTYQDASEFKTAMSGQYLVYEKAIPTTESSTPFTNPQDVYAGGTEEFVDSRDVPIPVGHETIYSNAQEITGYDEVVITHGTDETDPNPTEYQVLFQSQGTVYSGSLDVLHGILTVNMAEVDLGTLNWSKHSTYDNTFFVDVDSINPDSTSNNLICSKYPCVVRSQSQRNKTISKSTNPATSKRIFIVDSAYTDTATFKSEVSGVQLVYELKTPLTYNLTPVEVEMLLNSNYLKSDGGVMTLTYKGTNPAILLMNKLRTNALMRKSKELQNGNLQPILPTTSRKL